MDAIEILGSLLGQKSSGSGAGADILKEIFLGGSRKEAPATTGRAQMPREVTEQSVDRQAGELEDLLNVANSRSSGRTTGQPRPQAQPPQRPQAPRQPAEPESPASWAPSGAASGQLNLPEDDEAQRQNEQALVLVRAMVNAAKCDGQVSQAEQQAILSRLGDRSPEAIQFLREEFAKPLDVREFAWSVPVGMEQQVYTMSLIAIDVDSDREERYLRELARGLRLSPDVCEQIKERTAGGGARYAGVR
jgi:uncharacterized membrane protein YebE (DUF533 family)